MVRIGVFSAFCLMVLPWCVCETAGEIRSIRELQRRVEELEQRVGQLTDHHIHVYMHTTHNEARLPCDDEKQAVAYKAAVYEHEVVVPDFTQAPFSRVEALATMHRNLAIYSRAAKQASDEGVGILAFPQYGITGLGWRGDRNLIRPFLEPIPSASTHWNPCLQPNMFRDTEIQVALSCMARENKLYLVANLGEIEHCCNSNKETCPSDGRFQYNTNVVYAPNGEFIAKYRKYNLFYEYHFDQPLQPESLTFETPFGTFGMFTCFDILFEKPAIELVQTLNVTNIVMTTSWIDDTPYLTSVQIHSSFAIAHSVNLLVSNIHLPEHRFVGSGIYTPNGALGYVYSKTQSGGAALVIQTVNATVRRSPPVFPKDFSAQAANVQNETNAFVSIMYGDNHNLVQLSERAEHVVICHNELCCESTYHLSVVNVTRAYFYAIAAFSGPHKHTGYFVQACSLVRCRTSPELESCGEMVLPAVHRDSGALQGFTLHGNFSTPYVYPQIVLDGGSQLELTPYPRQWTFANGVLASNSSYTKPIAIASLFARVRKIQ